VNGPVWALLGRLDVKGKVVVAVLSRRARRARRSKPRRCLIELKGFEVGIVSERNTLPIGEEASQLADDSRLDLMGGHAPRLWFAFLSERANALR
jgi:hypothetical protein